MEKNALLIRGITRAGKKFRPSDWSERLASVLAEFGRDHRESFSPLVHPLCVDGLSCVMVDKRLAERDTLAWNFVLDFARDNDLTVTEESLEPGSSHLLLCPTGDASA